MTRRVMVAAWLAVEVLAAQVARPTPPEIVPDLSRDAVKLAAGRYSVELENDQVRVLRVKLAPGEKVPIHDARAGVVVALTEVHVRLVRADKGSQQVELAPGATQWVYEDAYATTNAGVKPAEFLIIEMKRRRGGAGGG